MVSAEQDSFWVVTGTPRPPAPSSPLSFSVLHFPGVGCVQQAILIPGSVSCSSLPTPGVDTFEKTS